MGEIRLFGGTGPPAVVILPPTALSASTVSDTAIDLAWTDNAANEDNYEVERSLTGTDTWSLIATIAANSTSYSDTGLTQATEYYYRVRAVASGGQSTYSNVSSSVTSSLPIAAPSGLINSVFSQSAILLNWTDNSDNETLFEIESSPDGIGSWVLQQSVGANFTAIYVTGLSASTLYFFRIRAVNALAQSGYSNTTSGATFSAPIVNPSGLTAVAASATSINLNWVDNSDNETGFEIERSLTGIGAWPLLTTVGANVTSYSDTSLTPATLYHYRVRAVNATVQSGYSNEASDTTNNTIPLAPSSLVATVVSQSTINLTWVDNSSLELSFELERSLTGAAPWSLAATPAADATSYSDTTLSEGVEYFYRIRAHGTAGDSAYSNTASGSTALNPPTGLTATPVGSSQIDLAWADNSFVETGFEIDRSPDGLGSWVTIASPAANATSYSDTGLASNTPFFYRVRAVAGALSSSYDEDSTTTSIAAPTGLSATTASSASIDLAWTDNSSSETGFQVERSLTGGAPWAVVTTTAANATAYTDIALSASTLYFYRVRAAAASPSAYSNTASDTTDAASASFQAEAKGWWDQTAGTVKSNAVALYPAGGAGAGIDGASQAGLAPTGGATWAGWIYLDGYAPADPQTDPIFARGATSYYLNLLTGTSGPWTRQLNFRVYQEGSPSTIIDHIGSGSVPVNSWVHIAVTFVSGTVTTYINGALDSSTSGPVTQIAINNPSNFSFLNVTWGTDVLMAPWAVWAKTLSVGEVAAMHNAGVPQIHSELSAAQKVGLVSFWNNTEWDENKADSVGINNLSAGGTTYPSGSGPVERNAVLGDAATRWINQGGNASPYPDLVSVYEGLVGGNYTLTAGLLSNGLGLNGGRLKALTGALTQDNTIVVVVTLSSAPAVESFLIDSDSTGGDRQEVTASPGRNISLDADVVLTGDTIALNIRTIITVVASGGTSIVRVNGVEVTGAAGASNLSGLSVGNAANLLFPWLGIVEKLVLIDRALSGAEILALEASL